MDFDCSGMIDFTNVSNATFNQDVVRPVQNPMAFSGTYLAHFFIQFTEFNLNAQEPNLGHHYLDLLNPQWYPAEDISAFVYPPFPEFPFDINLSLFSPPTITPERSAAPSLLHLPSSDMTFEGPSATQPLADIHNTPLPTPPVPIWQPTPHQIRNFNYCPYTENGKICGFTTWSESGTKTVERHMKRRHLEPGFNAKAWRCPNPDCKRNGRSFRRKDTLTSHRRKSCDPWHAQKDPDYIPLPNIEQGNDEELRRWMTAGFEQRNSIRGKLRAGTPWGVDLLQPIHL